MNKKYIVYFSLSIIALIMGGFIYNNYLVNKPNQPLNGTFVSQSDLYSYLIFDERDDHSFYYLDSDGIIMDQGTYLIEFENKYQLNGDKMENIELHYTGNILRMRINDIDYVFKRTHNQPIIQIYE